jgi:hypothetical protein
MRRVKSGPSDECTTPRFFFERVSKFYGDFTLDAAANCRNRHVPRFCGKCICETQGLLYEGHDISCKPENEDGLEHDWSEEIVWCNPPYSNVMPWIIKAQTARRAVLLLKSDHSTKWFREAHESSRIILLSKRLKFGGYGKNQTPNFPSMLAVFGYGEVGKISYEDYLSEP